MVKRTFKPADVPPRRRAVGTGTTAPIFTAEDVAAIVPQVLPIMKGRNPSHIAAAWSDAFFHAAEFLAFEVHDAPSELRDFYAGVDKAARALLMALGFTGDPALVIAEIEAGNARPVDAIERMKWLLSNADEKAAPKHFNVAVRVAPPDYKQRNKEPFNAGLDAAPYAVALLALSAQLGRKFSANALPAKSGPKSSKFQRELFEILAGGFGYAFGFAPDTSSERLEKDNASQVWIAWLFGIAAERIAECIMLDVTDKAERAKLADAHPLVCKVREMAQLAPVTLADLLAKGQRRKAAVTPGAVVSF